MSDMPGSTETGESMVLEKSLTKTRVEVLMLFVLYLFILPRVYMDYDMGFWRNWALEIHRHGLGAVYNSTINYFPVYIYGLYIYDMLQGTEANIIQHINNIKILFVCFDFLPVIVLCCFRQKILSFKIPYLFLLINIAYVFTSMVWGQIDSIYTNLAFLAIITGILYPVTGILLYLLALNTKQQAIEFLPIIFAVLLYGVRNVKTVVLAVIGIIVLQTALLLPFISNGGVGKLVTIAGNTVGLYHNLSICAFNIWYLIARGNPYFIVDTDKYILFSYRTIGLALFTISALLLLVPFLKRIWRARTAGVFDAKMYEALFLTTGLLCLFFFYFNTQMHERYAHPIIIFFFFYGVVSKNYKLYILASIPYVLSLDKCFSYPGGYLPIVHYKIIYASVIIAIWYTVTVVYGSCLFYRLMRSPRL